MPIGSPSPSAHPNQPHACPTLPAQQTIVCIRRFGARNSLTHPRGTPPKNLPAPQVIPGRSCLNWQSTYARPRSNMQTHLWGTGGARPGLLTQGWEVPRPLHKSPVARRSGDPRICIRQSCPLVVRAQVRGKTGLQSLHQHSNAFSGALTPPPIAGFRTLKHAGTS